MKKREKKLKHVLKNLYCFYALFALMGTAVAAQAPNPRSTGAALSSPRSESKIVAKRGAGENSRVISDVSRTAMRNGSTVVTRGLLNGPARSLRVKSRAGVNVAETSARSASKKATMSRAATLSRSGALVGASIRGAGSATVSNSIARAATPARATAVFNDVSKIGGGYAQCRESYATCMDQFCANANDTYRRCFCSSRYSTFRDTELALDEAKVLLQRFEDNNLNAVDKTADEVNAMYSATVGEAAIKNDVSGAQAVLNEISDLLSGKKKATPQEEKVNMVSADFSSDMDDIWGGASNSIFETAQPREKSMSELEGIDLYNVSNKNCLEIIGSSCENQAILNMSTSAYNIMITQDCNLYEKKIEKQRESVMQTVRQAEKYLREARLEEYRAHNSADVNECIAKVKTAMLQDMACGPDYRRCLDYSGVYINSVTGEPIYSPRLFQLIELIKLDGSSDVVGQNKEFNKFLDNKRKFAESALDTCRDDAELVWSEFKRSAIIEIAQAQDAKIEEVKMSCVSTMAECYDAQSQALKDFDKNTAKVSGALAANAARGMCKDKVLACAALYGDSSKCSFDANGKLTSKAGTCGLAQLLNFVDGVDSVRIAEGCAEAIESKLKELCTPTSGDKKYPWNCINLSRNDMSEKIKSYKTTYCELSGESDPQIMAELDSKVAVMLNEVEEAVSFMLEQECTARDGYWLWADGNYGELAKNQLLTAFYNQITSGNKPDVKENMTETDREKLQYGGAYGLCVENTTKIRCESYNITASKAEEGEEGEEVIPYARYDATKDECVFSDEWYKNQCTVLGGLYESNICYLPNE